MSADEQQAIEQADGAIASGDLSRAQGVLDSALAAGCESVRLRRMLGSVLGASGQLDRAREELERVLQTNRADAGVLTDLGNVHQLCGRDQEAEVCYRHALEHDSENRHARFNLALLDAKAGRLQVAIGALQSLLEYPAYAQAVHSLTEVLDRAGRSQEAKHACMEVLAREPDHAVAHVCLGTLLLKRELKPREALEHFDRAIALGYAGADVWSNRGIALQDLARLDEAIVCYETALRIKPGHRLAAFHRSLALLMRGEFRLAWPDYELRLLSEDQPEPPGLFPVWDGAALADGALLVYGEQGLGDQIMFASCLPELLDHQREVVIACNPKLVTLFRRSFPTTVVMSLPRKAEAIVDSRFARVRAMTAIGSLPLHFRSSRESFPRRASYLIPDPELVREYRARLAELGTMPKIGISWRGGTVASRRDLRSLNAEQVMKLLATPGVQFIDLQYDSQREKDGVSAALRQSKLIRWEDALGDYDRTAALVCALDSVVSVCTAVIHLAGALGRPVLVMAPYSPEWRYGISGETMPWYPSVRIQRQPSSGDWDSVICAVQSQLARATHLNETFL